MLLIIDRCYVCFVYFVAIGCVFMLGLWSGLTQDVVAAGYRMSVPGGAGGAVGAGAGWGGAPQPLMYSAAAMPSGQYPSQ